MCDPVTLTVVAIGVTMATQSTMSAVSAEQSREAQKELAKRNARLQRGQVYSQLQQETEANAQKSLELARQAQIARGAAKAANLADRSVRAIGRSIGFQLGTDQATLERNQQIAAEQAAARLTGIDITLQSQKEQIGDTSGFAMGMDITSGLIQAGVSTAMLGATVGLGGGGAGSPATQLDASNFMDFMIA